MELDEMKDDVNDLVSEGWVVKSEKENRAYTRKA